MFFCILIGVTYFSKVAFIIHQITQVFLSMMLVSMEEYNYLYILDCVQSFVTLSMQ